MRIEDGAAVHWPTRVTVTYGTDAAADTLVAEFTADAASAVAPIDAAGAFNIFVEGITNPPSRINANAITVALAFTDSGTALADTDTATFASAVTPCTYESE